MTLSLNLHRKQTSWLQFSNPSFKAHTLAQNSKNFKQEVYDVTYWNTRSLQLRPLLHHTRNSMMIIDTYLGSFLSVFFWIPCCWCNRKVGQTLHQWSLQSLEVSDLLYFRINLWHLCFPTTLIKMNIIWWSCATTSFAWLNAIWQKQNWFTMLCVMCICSRKKVVLINWMWISRKS